jgi:hypothetical protein
MDQQFVDSYRQATLERDDKFLRGRWKLVAEVSSKLSASGALELIRVCLDLPSYDRSSIATLLDAVKDPGPQYARPEITLELRLLAGIIIERLLHEPSLRITRIADLTASALLCSRSWRPNIAVVRPLSPLVEAAFQQISERSVMVRRLPNEAPKIDLPIPTLPSIAITEKETKYGFEIPVKIHDRYNGGEQIQKTAFSLTIKEIDTALLSEWNKETSRKLQQYATDVITVVNKKFQEAVRALPSARSILAEENNILWWLFGEASNTSKKPFSKISLPILYIVIANELNSLTQQTPGPSAAMAYIDRALRSGRSSLPDAATIAELVAAVSADSRPSWQKLMRPQLADLCPIMQSICAGTDMSAKESGRYAMELPATEFTFQLYQELILHRLHREVVG